MKKTRLRTQEEDTWGVRGWRGEEQIGSTPMMFEENSKLSHARQVLPKFCQLWGHGSHDPTRVPLPVFSVSSLPLLPHHFSSHCPPPIKIPLLCHTHSAFRIPSSWWWWWWWLHSWAFDDGEDGGVGDGSQSGRAQEGAAAPGEVYRGGRWLQLPCRGSGQGRLIFPQGFEDEAIRAFEAPLRPSLLPWRVSLPSFSGNNDRSCDSCYRPGERVNLGMIALFARLETHRNVGEFEFFFCLGGRKIVIFSFFNPIASIPFPAVNVYFSFLFSFLLPSRCLKSFLWVYFSSCS